MSDQKPAVIKLLTSAALRRRKAEAQALQARRETDDLIVQGYEQGVPKQQLAEAAGLTRQTVYTVLHKARVTT